MYMLLYTFNSGLSAENGKINIYEIFVCSFLLVKMADVVYNKPIICSFTEEEYER